jgi:predicted nuclease of restriction endonuclease-like (RecB) superfamily
MNTATDMPISLTTPPEGYTDWLGDLKARIHAAQQRATLSVNRELVLLYWQIGRDILTRQVQQGWGAKVIERLGHDLRSAFPEMKGFSPRNLKYMRAFSEAWPDSEFVQGVLAQLPWYHQLALLDKLDTEQERAVENALVKHVTEFLLELGAGFAFVGRQVLLDVGGDEFFIDLLFYHLKLRCYVVIELKGGKFKPEHLGQLDFYLTAIDRQVKNEYDNPTIGLLLCKSKNKIVAEYALGDNTQPMGVAEYKLMESLPAELQTSLPTIEQIERELMGGNAVKKD